VFVFSTNTIFNGTIPYVAYGAASDFLQSLPSKYSLESWAKNVSAAANKLCKLRVTRIPFQYSITLDLKRGLRRRNNYWDNNERWARAEGLPLFLPLVADAIFKRKCPHPLARSFRVPDINPSLFLVGFESDVQIGIAKWTRKFWSTEPAKSLATEISPGSDALPANATDLKWASGSRDPVTVTVHKSECWLTCSHFQFSPLRKRSYDAKRATWCGRQFPEAVRDFKRADRRCLIVLQ
jgi:hypothetical protein